MQGDGGMMVVRERRYEVLEDGHGDRTRRRGVATTKFEHEKAALGTKITPVQRQDRAASAAHGDRPGKVCR